MIENRLSLLSHTVSTSILRWASEIKQPTYIEKILITQLVRSATSVEANAAEASFSISRKDFISKL